MLTLAQATTAVATKVAEETSVPIETSVWDTSKWDGTTWAAVGMGLLAALLIVIWGALRFWLVVTRPAKIKDVHTPTLDRLNQAALSHMGADGDGEIEAPDAPSDLLAAVPEEEPESPDAKEPDKV